MTSTRQAPLSAGAEWGARDSIRRATLGPLLARMISLAVSLASTTLYTRLLVEAIGVAGFAAISLVIGATWIQPILSDGSRTVVVNAVARQGRAEPDVPRLLRACRVQLGIGGIALGATVVAAVIADVYRGHPWAWLVLLVGTSVALNAATSPGTAVLQGLGRQATIGLLPIVVGLSSLGLLAAMLYFGAEMVAAAAGPLAGSVVSILAMVWTVRKFGLPVASLSALKSRSQASGDRIMGVAVLYSIVSVLFFLSDRYVMAAVGETSALAGLVVLQSISTPLISLTGTVGDGLWALVERRRALGSLGNRGAVSVFLSSSAIGVALGGVVIAIWPAVCRFTLGVSMWGPDLLAISMAMLVAASGVKSGASALLRTRAGLQSLAAIWAFGLLVKLGVMLSVARFIGPQAAILSGVIVYIAATLATAWRAFHAPSKG